MIKTLRQIWGRRAEAERLRRKYDDEFKRQMEQFRDDLAPFAEAGKRAAEALRMELK